MRSQHQTFDLVVLEATTYAERPANNTEKSNTKDRESSPQPVRPMSRQMVGSVRRVDVECLVAHSGFAVRVRCWRGRRI